MKGTTRAALSVAVVLLTGLLAAGFAFADAIITISGTIRYTAATGNEADDAANGFGLKPVRDARIELWDDNSLFLGLPPDVIVGSTYTDNAGKFSFSVSDADSLTSALAGTLDPYLRIFPATEPALPAAGGIKSSITMYAPGTPDANGRDTLGNPWEFDSVKVANIPAGANYSINVDMGSGTDAEKSFAAFDSMVEASRYYSSLPGSVNNSVNTVFPTGENTSNFSNSRMHILQGDRYDWDVAMHEYGHFVQSQTAGISNSPGGGHGDNNLRFSRAAGGADLNPAGTNTLNRRQANQLAWGEGWATFYSISAQRESNSAALGIQRVGDTNYHDNKDNDGVSLGTRDGIESKSIGGPSLGEDNENSVARILYDLYDANNEAAERDRVTMGAVPLWNLIRTNSVDSVDKLWKTLTTQPGTTNSKRIDYGAIFEAQNVSPQPDETSVPNGTQFPEFDLNPPTFKWKVPKGGQSNVFNTNLLHDFGLKIFDSADNELLDSGLLGDVTDYTPNVFDWLGLTAATDTLRWIVYGQEKNTIDGSDYITGNFWSDARTFSVVPEPGTAALILIAIAVGGCGIRRERTHA